ncbi:putative DNA-binding transcriptional regulator [Actinomadura rubteroloni]|uniref:Putative DNA-binding transcriptional regulator n=1 Tax=Actinomadura rubteroloni TaxID=1926885 RepID=A0A2P4UK98_9ACTN|nr:TetR/AcrR family transcriptional regulator [Actinomadura rubteroloni]POM25471.1 putative DNA-binding transcriptional regulator [Actinomadura rubteroloni]
MTGTVHQARPRRDREATRRRILDAARDLFGTQGYDTVTLRMIGTAADANPALVNRYFGTKAQLFAEVIEDESTLPQAIAGDPAGLPRRLAEHVVRQVRSRPQSRFPRIVDRSIGDPEVQRVLSEYMTERVIEPLAAQLSGPDARARATLAAVLVMGGAPARRLIGIDVLQDDPADLARRLTAMFTAALF